MPRRLSNLASYYIADMLGELSRKAEERHEWVRRGDDGKTDDWLTGMKREKVFKSVKNKRFDQAIPNHLLCFHMG